MPRPRIITDDLVRAAVKRINAGQSVNDACKDLGIHRDSLMTYIRVTRRMPGMGGHRGPAIVQVAAIGVQATATAMIAPAPYARGYRW